MCYDSDTHIYVVIFHGCVSNRNSETSSAMRGQSNGGLRGIASPDRGAHDKRGSNTNNHSNNHHHHNENNKSAASSETAHDSKKGGSSSGSGEATPPVWPPKFVIALTNKEKEEDFMAIKGSKLPQRPKKRAKLIQRTLNVSSNLLFLSLFSLHFFKSLVYFIMFKFNFALFSEIIIIIIIIIIINSSSFY